MAFDIRNLFGPGALNMLLQPTNGQNAQNLLMQMPDVGAPPAVASPQPNPMTTAALAGPAPQPTPAAPQMAGGGGRESMGLNIDPAKKQFFQDMFLGWAAGATPEQSLALGAAQAVSGRNDRQNTNQTVEWLKGRGMDEAGARTLAGNPSALGDYLKGMYGQKSQGMLNVPKGGTIYDQSTGQWLTPPAGAAGADQSEYGLNPQYGVDANGNAVILQLSKDGTSKQTALPNGVTLSKEPIKLDAGTHFVLLDPITRQPIGQIPKNVAGEASATVEGKAAGDARANLGQLEDNGNQILSTIDSLANDPYLDSMVGALDSRLPSFSSDAARVQTKMDQIQGQAFLQAFNSLRGGGQITEIEGKKATDAIAALNTAQNEADYRKALSTFRGVVETGLSRARSKAGAGSAPSGTPTAGGDPLSAARAAIAKGAPRDAVIQRLRQSGINPEGL